MSRFTFAEEKVESKTEKRIRIFLAVMFFIEVALTTFPFMQGQADEGFTYITAFNMLVQYNGYGEEGDLMLVIIGAILVILPMVAFFFCILDKRSHKKYAVSALSSVLCAVVITFAIGRSISLGGVITLVINVITLFMTMQGYQATRIRERASEKQ